MASTHRARLNVVCGIAGIMQFGRQRTGDSRALVGAMLDALAHRGPDGEGIWADDAATVVLGHRRLAIIDLTPAGAQPMQSSDGRYSITFNGEIYNYVELRKELESSGASFRGTSDTEVLLEAISRWGVEDALERTRGMFAFAMWDGRRRVLHLARDRVGKKPLYYSQSTTALVFASEIKAITGLPGTDRTVSQTALWHYLSLGFVPSPYTIYEAIREVPPGHRAEVAATGNVTITPYWRPRRDRIEAVPFEVAVEQLDALLRQAVARRLRSDVPVGVFLSGGLDSGVITALCAELAGTVSTFTARVPDPAMDESRFAGLVAARYATSHHVLAIDPDVQEILPTLAASYDEPFGDPSAVPTYCIAQAASAHVKVVLNGEGSDELFCGYRRHRALQVFDTLERLPLHGGTSALERLGATLPQPTRPRSGYAFAHRFLRGLADRTPGARYISWSADGFTESEKGQLFGLTAPSDGSTPQYLSNRRASASGSALDQGMALDFDVALPDCLLVKVDIATMAHGLEARCPFLDQDVAEWSFTLPVSVLLHGRETKPLMRSLGRRYLPDAIVSGPKRGFEIPVLDWLRGPLRDMVHDVVDARGALGQFANPSTLQAFVDGPGDVDADRWARCTWLLLMFGLWEDCADRVRRV